MNDDSGMPGHEDDAYENMPDWAKNLKDGDEIKLDFENTDMSDPASFKGGEGAWGNSDFKYDLEEANVFIRMTDKGNIDQDYFENYILPGHETTVKFNQTWFISLMHSDCKKEACVKLEEFHEQLFLMWLGETMTKPKEVEDQLDNVSNIVPSNSTEEAEAMHA